MSVLIRPCLGEDYALMDKAPTFRRDPRSTRSTCAMPSSDLQREGHECQHSQPQGKSTRNRAPAWWHEANTKRPSSRFEPVTRSTSSRTKDAMALRQRKPRARRASRRRTSPTSRRRCPRSRCSIPSQDRGRNNTVARPRVTAGAVTSSSTASSTSGATRTPFRRASGH